MTPQDNKDSRHRLRVVSTVAIFTASIIASIAIGYWAVEPLTTTAMPKWVLARSSGIASYLLLAIVSATGLLLSHPHRARWHWPTIATRLRLHVITAVFAITFTAIHLVILATDEYAKIGWLGAILPMTAEYRPLPVTLGIIAFYSMLTSAITASLASTKLGKRIWWPLHKIALTSFLLAWTHGILSGTDTQTLLPLYLVTGATISALAIWRYQSTGIIRNKKLFRKETQLEQNR
jgi:DMSO/TMAO reductase YedYZ heme-binding membrane subunit